MKIRDMSTEEIKARLRKLERGKNVSLGLRGWAYRDALKRRESEEKRSGSN